MTVQTPAAPAAPMESEISRREFLNYAWLASLGILLVEGGVVTYLFAMPRLEAGEFGGPVSIGAVDDLPDAEADPAAYNEAKFWWVATESGDLALYKVCTHLGCIFDWKTDQGKFICPCHGSQFTRDGDYITGPAPRSLDRMVIRAYDTAGALVAETNAAGDPLVIPDGASVVVETGEIIEGPSV
jgi:cytochrome b6-f complex iron-sulfur subunit